MPATIRRSLCRATSPMALTEQAKSTQERQSLSQLRLHRADIDTIEGCLEASGETYLVDLLDQG